MPEYRLVNEPGHPLGFTATDDDDALRFGREQAGALPPAPPRCLVRSHRVDRCDPDGWRLVGAWVPRPTAVHPHRTTGR